MSGPRQRTVAELRAMSAAEVVVARRAGELDSVMRGAAAEPEPWASGAGPIHGLLRRLSPVERAQALEDPQVLRELAAEKEQTALLPAEVAPSASEPGVGSADLGARGDPVKGQLGRDDLAGMSPAAIAKANRDGRLDALKRGER